MTWAFPKTLLTSKNFSGSFRGKNGASTHSSEHFFLLALQPAQGDIGVVEEVMSICKTLAQEVSSVISEFL